MWTNLASERSSVPVFEELAYSIFLIFIKQRYYFALVDCGHKFGYVKRLEKRLIYNTPFSQSPFCIPNRRTAVLILSARHNIMDEIVTREKLFNMITFFCKDILTKAKTIDI